MFSSACISDESGWECVDQTELPQASTKNWSGSNFSKDIWVNPDPLIWIWSYINNNFTDLKFRQAKGNTAWAHKSITCTQQSANICFDCLELFTPSNTHWREMKGHSSLSLSCLTLSGGFEVEGLEPASKGRRVDHIHSVFALAPAVQRHGYDKDCDGNGSCCQSWVQCHLVGTIHTCKSTETWRFMLAAKENGSAWEN